MISFRKATIDDASILFAWRNDPETRKMSINTHEILFNNHFRWLDFKLMNEYNNIFIVTVKSSPLPVYDIPIGTIRHQYSPEKKIEHELSWTVASWFRKKGLGKKMLKQFTKEFYLKSYCAMIKPNNIPSIKIAESIGMKRTKGNNNLLFYEKQ